MLFIVNVWNSATKIHCDLKFYVLHLVNIFNIAAIAQLTMLYTALFHAITLYRVTSLVSSSMLVARRKCSYSLFNQSLRMLMVIDAIFYSTLHTEYIDIFQFRYQISEFLSIFATCAVSNGLDVKYLDFTLTSYSFSRSMFHVSFFSGNMSVEHSLKCIKHA